MRRQFCLSLIFSALLFFSVQAQPTVINLPEIQTDSWNLNYQLSLQNQQRPQFADVVRKKTKKNPNELSEEEAYRRRILVGEAKIKAGKATTTFFYNPRLSLKNYLLLQADSMELRQIVEQYADVCLEMFRKSLLQNKLKRNDIADTSALAFVTAYEIYFGEMPSKEHLRWMQFRGREILLNSPGFQGVADADRQRAYEIYGVLTMYAKILRERGNQDALNEAKETAGEVLQGIWGSSADTIQILPVGFTHKGQKIINDGNATVSYKFNPSSPISRKLANGQSQTEAQYQTLLNNFYQKLETEGRLKNDLAACGTYSFQEVYPLIQDKKNLNVNQINSIYEMLKNASLRSTDIQAATDENKQFACEFFAIRAVLLKNRTDVTAKAAAGIFLRDLFNAYNEDFNDYEIIAEGLVKKQVRMVAAN
jgi:hypothetical protein